MAMQCCENQTIRRSMMRLHYSKMLLCFDYRTQKRNIKQIQRVWNQSKANDTPGIISEWKYPAMQSVHFNTLSNESITILQSATQPNESECGWWVWTSSPKIKVDFVWFETGSILIWQNGCARIKLLFATYILLFFIFVGIFVCFLFCLFGLLFNLHLTNVIIKCDRLHKIVNAFIVSFRIA